MASAKTTKAKKEAPAAAAKKPAEAAVKAKDEAPAATGSAALQSGKSAAGARFEKPGFAFTPEDDLAFALGYPHYFTLADNHPDDANPAKSAPLYYSKHDLDPPVWPRKVAAAVARGFGYQGEDDELKVRYGKKDPIGEAEARAIIKRDLREDNSWVLLFLLEALVGTSVVVDAVIGELESYTDKPWTDSGPETRAAIPNTVLRLGYLLLRLPVAEEEKARARLEALYKAWAGKAKGMASLRESARDSLDVVLHGKEGAERSAYKPDDEHISTGQPLFVHDDPAWILKTVKGSGAPDESSVPDPRLTFLGGEPVLALEIGWWKKYTKPGAQAQLVERFGKIKSPRILPWMLEMSATSKAKTSAAAWFKAHADYAQGFLEETAAGKSASAAWAKALLGKG